MTKACSVRDPVVFEEVTCAFCRGSGNGLSEMPGNRMDY